MSESKDLRTRIAAAIYADVIPTPPECVVEQVADAVIHALQLTEDGGVIVGCIHD